ncbi:zinc-binding dehydrogenase [Roseibium sp.]|uniref:zinc-binding dehydrogenase n=1 Tax=Roseibium sp. TaxID=1936156 RepID=UPI003296C45E
MQPKVPVGALILNNASVHGITVGNRADFQALCDFLSSNDIHPVIDRIFRFDEAPDAFSHLASGSQFGKICVDFTH